MKKICIVFIALLLSILASSQYTDFDLSMYKLPDIKTSRLDLELDLNHNVTSNKYNDDGTYSYDNFNRNFGGDLFASLYHFRNSSNYQGSQSFGINYEPDYRKSIINDSVNKDNRNLMYVYLNSVNRFYNMSSDFIEVQPYFHYQLSKAQSSDPNDSEKTLQNYLDFSVPVSAGHGRIEPVEDARLAIYILDELSKHGRIVNQPDEAKILELASEISKIKRKRFFDTRIRKIVELQAIDSFLVANNIVSSNDMVYFTRLNDQWDYASGPDRNSGFSVNFGSNNDVSIGRYKSETSLYGEQITRVNTFTVGGFGRLQYSKPINLHWQSDLTLDLPYDYRMTREPKGDLDGYNTHLLRPQLTYSIKYLPNSRTSIGLFLDFVYTYDFGKQRVDLGTGSSYQIRFSGNEFYSYSALDMYYYFSPQLRLQLDWYLHLTKGSDYRRSEEMSLDDHYEHGFLNSVLSVRLIYSFF